MNPSNLAVADNLALRRLIAAKIETEGSISFAEFMALALYHPNHGYYFTNDPTLDYQSSPNVHPLFGAMVARQLADFWRLLGQPARFDVFEAGAGSGKLAIDILQALRLDHPDLFEATRYVVQDVALNEAAIVSRFEELGLLSKVETAKALPAAPVIEGCILANELLDALPSHRVRKRDGRLWELQVGLKDGRLMDVEASPPPEVEAYFAALDLEPGEGCEAEVCLEAPAWMTRAAGALRRGYLLLFDYGYEADALYAPWRKQGTLLTFFQHTSGEDPYTRVGHQDITASVDFTTVRRAGEVAGLKTYGLTTQTEFLAAIGIGEVAAGRPSASELEAYYARRRAAIELTDPAGLGRIRVLIQGKETPGLLPRAIG